MPSLAKIIVFSKDRPFQCQQLLKSLLRYLVTSTSEFEFKLSVIFKTSFDQDCSVLSQYINLQEEFPTTKFVHENDSNVLPGEVSMDPSRTNLFGRALMEVLQEEYGESAENPQYIYFAVDDMLLYDFIPLSSVMKVLNDDPEIYCFHSKLHPGICFCHPKDKPCIPPRFTMLCNTNTTEARVQFLRFDRSYSPLDWNYPWDLTGGFYRKKDVMQMIFQINERFGQDSIQNPNVFEELGMQVARTMKLPPTSVCLSTCCLSVITVNKVQETYNTPVYSSVVSLDEMNSMLGQWEYDTKKYQACSFDSVHIGELFMKQITDEQEAQIEALPKELGADPELSVVLPCYNGGSFLRQAVESILNQSYRFFELIIIDDGSTDGCLATIEDLTHDPRLRIVSHAEQKGLVYSLNEGLQLSKAPLVARMDADDISLPHRFEKQVAFLDHNPDVAVVGTGIQAFHEDLESFENNQKTICHPTNPYFLAWSMLFSCPIAHPSVVFRKEKIIAVGAYDECACLAEDYDLWWKLINRGEKICNLGEILLYLRRHGQNISTLHNEKQKETALTIVHSACEVLQNTTLSKNHTKTMRNPHSSASIDDATGALSLLLNLEEIFVSCKVVDSRVPLNECTSVTQTFGKKMIQADVSSRVGELALASIAKYSAQAVSVLAKWVERCPDQQSKITNLLFAPPMSL